MCCSRRARRECRGWRRDRRGQIRYSRETGLPYKYVCLSRLYHSAMLARRSCAKTPCQPPTERAWQSARRVPDFPKLWSPPLPHLHSSVLDVLLSPSTPTENLRKHAMASKLAEDP